MIDIHSLKLIRSDDPSVEDDHFEIREHENFNIQVCDAETGPYDDSCYVVNEELEDGHAFMHLGEYTNLRFAINKINDLLETRNATK